MPTSLLVRLPCMSTLADRIKEAMNESGAIAGHSRIVGVVREAVKRYR